MSLVLELGEHDVCSLTGQVKSGVGRILMCILVKATLHIPVRPNDLRNRVGRESTKHEKFVVGQVLQLL